MSLGAGSLALKRYKVLVDNKNLDFNWIVDNLKSNLITPLIINDEKEYAKGWCHPFTGEPDMSEPFDILFDNVFVFGLRLDAKKIPGTFFRLQMKAMLDKLSSEKDTEEKKRLSKKFKDATRDRIKLELLKCAIPTIRLMEIAWNLDNNEIWLTSSSKSMYTEFEKMFYETFKLSIISLNASTMFFDFNIINEDKINLLCNIAPINMLKNFSNHNISD